MRDLADGEDHLDRGTGLVQVSAGAGLDRGEAGIVTFVAAQKHESDVGERISHRNGRVTTRPITEVVIHHDHVWAQGAWQGNGFRHRARLAYHLHVSLPVEQQAEALRDELMVFHDDDPNQTRNLEHTRRRRFVARLDLAHGVSRLRPARTSGQLGPPRQVTGLQLPDNERDARLVVSVSDAKPLPEGAQPAADLLQALDTLDVGLQRWQRGLALPPGFGPLPCVCPPAC